VNRSSAGEVLEDVAVVGLAQALALLVLAQVTDGARLSQVRRGQRESVRLGPGEVR
jgi:hypothetical protein